MDARYSRDQFFGVGGVALPSALREIAQIGSQ
jgi:hypothetical protein